eukprot:1636132-Heterocapsa_arctica.AAC.1
MDWRCPETDVYLASMTLDQLMSLRMVKETDGTIMTIPPWAYHLNDSRCTYCSRPDRRNPLSPSP